MAMQDLRLIGVHEDGEHLLLSDADGGRFRVRVDEPLRTAVRHDRPRLGQQQVEADASLRPRDVQALIRAGSSAEEVAERSGWTVDKVRRYEGPIVAEREHVAGLSRGVRVRGRSSGAGAPTLSVRVAERLKGRGVDPSAASWDAWREEGGPWTVVVTFAAGGRQRQASWHFDLADRTVTAIDDEARWLSEEEEPVPGPIPAPHLSQGPGRTTTTVYDVEAEGGLRAAARPAAATVEPTDAERPVRAERDPEPLDLMTAMRERSTARGRRKSGARRGPRKSPTHVPGAGEHVPDDAVPLEDMAYDPETMPPPPAAHDHPDLPDPLDARPEPLAAACAEAAGLALADASPAPQDGDDDATDAEEPEVAAAAITVAEAETAEVLESVQSLESPHRSDEPVATPADDDTDDHAADHASEVAAQDVAVEPEPAPEPAATVASSTAQDLAPEAVAAPDAEQPEAAEPVAERPVARERTAEQPELEQEAGDTDAEEPEAAEPADELAPKPAPPARPSSRRNGRPSVPSWDDSMFGARPGGRS
jgi:hypothetical protein